MGIIHYTFADEHTGEIEVRTNLPPWMNSCIKYKKKVERKETRRHISLIILAENGIELSARTWMV